MKLQNLSVRAFLRKIVAGTLLTAALLLLIFFLLTKDVRVVICGIILTAAFFIWGMVFLHYFQKKLSLFTDGLCQTLDHMMDSTDRPQVDYEAETLLSRISHRLERLYIEEFDGISLVEWTEDNRIKSLKEFGCNRNTYNPYQEGDTPQFRVEKANWF